MIGIISEPHRSILYQEPAFTVEHLLLTLGDNLRRLELDFFFRPSPIARVLYKTLARQRGALPSGSTLFSHLQEVTLSQHDRRRHDANPGSLVYYFDNDRHAIGLIFSAFMLIPSLKRICGVGLQDWTMSLDGRLRLTVRPKSSMVEELKLLYVPGRSNQANAVESIGACKELKSFYTIGTGGWPEPRAHLFATVLDTLSHFHGDSLTSLSVLDTRLIPWPQWHVNTGVLNFQDLKKLTKLAIQWSFVFEHNNTPKVNALSAEVQTSLRDMVDENIKRAFPCTLKELRFVDCGNLTHSTYFDDRLLRKPKFLPCLDSLCLTGIRNRTSGQVAKVTMEIAKAAGIQCTYGYRSTAALNFFGPQFNLPIMDELVAGYGMLW